jgi:hypothetical protein
MLYHPPHMRKWYWNLALAVIYFSAMFVLFRLWENKINPQNFDLNMQQRIQETEQLVKENLESRDSN